jgi:hypothetical protein
MGQKIGCRAVGLLGVTSSLTSGTHNTEATYVNLIMHLETMKNGFAGCLPQVGGSWCLVSKLQPSLIRLLGWAWLIWSRRDRDRKRAGAFK